MAKASLPNNISIDNSGRFRPIHGAAANQSLTPEYQAWVSARNRCYNPKNKDYRKYGARGITVCDRWINGENGQHPFECFLQDMGAKPSPQYSLDRKDVNGPYSPQNCRWATSKAQGRNRRTNRHLVCNGKKLTLVEWAEETGLIPETIAARLRWGWSIEQALGFVPAPKIETLEQKVRELGNIKVGTVRYRMKRGMSFEEAVSLPVRGQKSK